MKDIQTPALLEKEKNYQHLTDTVRHFIKVEAEELGLHGDSQKIGVLTSRPYDNPMMIEYEREFALLLSRMKEDEQIIDWFPAPPYSKLDNLKVDFLVEIREGEYLPFQVTSTVQRVSEHYSSIEKKYPMVITKKRKGPIKIINMIHRSGDNVDEDSLRYRVIKSQKRIKSIAV